jgi:hypothetical protein
MICISSVDLRGSPCFNLDEREAGRDDLPSKSMPGYSESMSSGDFISILRLSGYSALALGLLLRPAR